MATLYWSLAKHTYVQCVPFLVFLKAFTTVVLTVCCIYIVLLTITGVLSLILL